MFTTPYFYDFYLFLASQALNISKINKKFITKNKSYDLIFFFDAMRNIKKLVG